MDYSAKGFAAIVQLLSDSPVQDLSVKPASWQQRPPIHHPVPNRRTEAVVCPLPVRPVGAPCLVDSANGMVYCCRPKDTFSQRQQQRAEMELLDFLGGGDDGGFFFGTPPARTGNPIVNDAEFRKQSYAAVAASNTPPPVNYSPYYHPAATPSPRGDGRGSNGSYGPPPPSSSSTFTSVPNIRVEGFPSAGSDSHHPRRRIVSALA